MINWGKEYHIISKLNLKLKWIIVIILFISYLSMYFYREIISDGISWTDLIIPMFFVAACALYSWEEKM